MSLGPGGRSRTKGWYKTSRPLCLVQKWNLFLKIWIDRSIALTLWLWGSTNFIWMLSTWSLVLINFDATLSMILKLGMNLILVMYYMWVWNPWPLSYLWYLLLVLIRSIFCPIVQDEDVNVSFDASDGGISCIGNISCTVFIVYFCDEC